MQSLILEKYDQLVAICRAHHVQRLAVFGSAVRDDFDVSRSDIDLIYEFKPDVTDGYARNLLSLSNDLEGLFGRQVDLIDLKYVRNPYLRRSILRDEETVYAA